MAIREFANYIQFIGSISIALLCIINYKRISMPFRAIGYYALTSILFQVAQYYVMYFNNYRGVNEIGDGFVLAESILFSIIFLLAFNSKNATLTIAFVVVIYILFYSWAVLSLPNASASSIRIGRELLMILLSIGYLYHLIKALPENDLLSFPMFWVSAAVLFYFSGTFILSLVLDYFPKVTLNKPTYFWTFRNFFRFGFCMVIAYATWIDTKIHLTKPR
jgi:hypothetical protein